MPLQATSGAASYDGFGGGVPFTPTYIEDVFSTWLYTGNNTARSIVNGIDLAGKGGLVWIKDRDQGGNHALYSTATGVTARLSSNSTAGANNQFPFEVTSFNADGFSLGTGSALNGAFNYASWTFRKQPKFFDVVTWTGNGANPRQIAHNLGSVPGCIIVKSTTRAENWTVYHRSLGNAARLALNTTDAQVTGTGIWASTTPTSTHFTVSADNLVNFNGDGYVAYLFAHNAGGFGLTGTDNVISCGSFVGTGALQSITLGYEPQWILFKRASGATDNWRVLDNMRGWSITSQQFLFPNTADTEAGSAAWGSPTATGMNILGSNGDTYIYIAIRRGPMKTPTTGTSVFNPVARTGTGTNPTVVTTNNNPDLLMSFPRTASPAAYGMCFWDKLRGISPILQSATTSSETNTNTTRVLQGWLNTGYQAGADFIEGYLNYSGSDYVNYPITRAPGFFDVVCNTITSFAVSGNHNLGVVPQMIIGKRRDSNSDWFVYHIGLTGVNSQGKPNQQILLNSSAAPTTAGSNGYYVDLTATTYDTFWWPSTSGTAVLYFFASVPGVSKVGSYTGNGSSQTIDMGFTGGARFFLVKRSDNVGSWLVYDSARGIVAPNDPALQLNSTAAEITSADAVDPASVGIIVNQENTFNININGGTYIYLAIA